MNEVREYTSDEIAQLFIQYVRETISYWETLPEKTLYERLEGVAFSILVAIDGDAIALPGFALIPGSNEDDREWLREMGINWYPENCDIAGDLHERLLDKAKPTVVNGFAAHLAQLAKQWDWGMIGE